MADNDKWLEIVRKLLAKAEDPACSLAEAEAINDKVTQLIAKHSIDEAMLKASNNVKEEIISITVHVPDPYEKAKGTLLGRIAATFNCMRISLTEKNKYKLIGHMSDVEKVYMLYLSLNMQMQGQLVQAQVHKPAYEHGKTFNASFVTGYVVSASDKVKIAYASAMKDVKDSSTGNGMELVLKNRKEQVLSKVHEEFPRLTFGRTALSSNSQSGYGHGKAAGQRADVGSSRIGRSGGGRAIGS